jgi:hypothetical protein
MYRSSVQERSYWIAPFKYFNGKRLDLSNENLTYTIFEGANCTDCYFDNAIMSQYIKQKINYPKNKIQ